MSRNRIAMGLLSMAFLASCTKDVKEPQALSLDESVNSEQLGAAAARQGGITNVPNELLIKFKKGTSETGRANALARISGKVQEHILTKAMQRLGDNDGVYLVHTPLNALEAIAKAKGLEVEYAEPNWIYTHNATSNDTYYSNLWGMKGGNGCNAETAWTNNKTNASSVYIGIIDEGYMYTHEDLAPNAAKNPKEETGQTGVDDDGNGYVDDIYGWDFDGNNNSVFDGTGDDHGTHVAGTIGGVGGNGKGVAGVVWSVKLLSAKFLGSRGGTTANAIKAVDYFTDLKNAQGLNIVATNNSWGGGGFSQGLQDAIERANDAGILFIAAAGNDSYNLETTNSYPAEYPNANIISVASITSSGALSSFSNYGSTGVDLGAPGSSIASTVPKSSKGKVVSGYASYSGTSMATPHVTGAAALYAAQHPGSTAAAIKSAILSTVTKNSNLTGKCVTGGQLNVITF